MNDSIFNKQFSKKVCSIAEALSIYMNQITYDQKRRGKDVTVLSLGEAFFDIPMFDFSKLDFSAGYHYSDSQGVPELRKKIADYYSDRYGADIDHKKEIIIGAGSKSMIFFTMQAILNPGDELLIHEPSWLSYQEQAKIVGSDIVAIPYYEDVKDFIKYISHKTKLIILNNPNNPAGKVYSAQDLKFLYEECAKKDIYIMVDEAYSDFVDNDEFCSMAKIAQNKEGVIVVNSLSKNLGMSGWRIGYAIAHPFLIAQILKLNQHIVTCAPTILQYYLARYFNKILDITLPQLSNIVDRRHKIAQFIDDLGLKRMPGCATFYFLIDLEYFPGSSLDFALYLLLYHGISVVPGSAYGDSCARYIRIGIGSESDERIQDALYVIKDLILNKNFDASIIAVMLEKEGFHMFDQKIKHKIDKCHNI